MTFSWTSTGGISARSVDIVTKPTESLFDLVEVLQIGVLMIGYGIIKNEFKGIKLLWEKISNASLVQNFFKIEKEVFFLISIFCFF